MHTCGTIRISEVVVPAGERASAEECLKTSLSHTVRDKNGPVYYYDFNAADRRCKSRSCNALQPIGTTDRHGDWFFGIHADRRGARYHRRHETAVILVRETVREKEQWHIHVHIQNICIHIYGIAVFSHFSFRRVAIDDHNRFKATDVLPATVGRIVLSLPLDGEVSRAKRHFSSGRISLENRRHGSGQSVLFASRRLNGEIDSWNMGSMRVEHLAPRLRF